MYELVETRKDFHFACENLRTATALAVDTEFVGERSYYPSLELVQVSDGAGQTFLIDVRAVGDIRELGPLLADEGVLKIFHAANQDLTILRRATGACTAPHFDTQLAAAMAGLGAQISHTNLVRDLLGVELENHQTVSDWSRRPLTRDQLDYAAEDVRHLHELRARLEEKLRRSGRLEWFWEEQRGRGPSEDDEAEMDDNDRYTTVKEWMKLNGQALAILQALAAWRERTARTEDLPRRQVMPDTGLIGLARAKPRKRDDLKGIRYAPQGAVFRYADEILGVIAAACQIPQSEWPRKVHSPRPDIPTGFVEILQALVRTTAEEEGIASTLLATTADLNTIVTNRRRLDEVEVEVLKGWRNELVGRKLVALLNGELKLRIVDGERIVFE